MNFRQTVHKKEVCFFMTQETVLELTELLQSRKYGEVKLIVQQMNEVDAAETIEDIFDESGDGETLIKLFRLLPKDTAAEAFAYIHGDVRQRLIELLSDTELSYILDDLYLDDYVDLVEEMPSNVVKRLMQVSSPENRSLINEYLRYPKDSAGSLMTNEYVYLKPRLTVEQAFGVIRSTGIDKETIYTCYVISGERRLEGVITIKELLLADPKCQVADIMDTNVIHAHTVDDREEVAKLFYKYDMIALPVVDNEERLVGIITVDDAVDVLQEENTEDFEKMAGMAPSEEEYLKTPIRKLAKNRIVWLAALMLSSMLTGAMLEHFEAAIAAIPLLVSFIPMLMDTGGNSGTQASTMVIRGLALDEIEPRDALRVWFKEIRVALFVSAALALINFARIMIQYNDVSVAAIVSLTLIATVCIAKSLGCLLPLLAKKLKLDPALMATPVLTTVTDAASILVYFSLTMRILGDRL